MYIAFENLVIQNFEEKDLDDLYKLLSDENVMKHLEPVFSREKSADFLKTAGLAENPLIYKVCRNNNFIGYVIYHKFNEESYEIGWVLSPKEWGKGIADKLTKILMEFSKNKCDYLVIECTFEQVISKHIALKNGFEYFGKSGELENYRFNLIKEII